MTRTSMPASPPRFGDERGAVLVLGIFMAACMVGMLWYLAGLGMTVLYRERLQETADAVGFSAAVLHARGMNLLVLINLIMACVLGVRVAMKVVQAAAATIGVIALFIPGGQGVAAQSFTIAGRMQMVIMRAERPIDNGLKALSRAQKGIAMVVPTASLAGALQVGTKYRPAVFMSEALNLELFQRPGSGLSGLKSLPVSEGSEDRLCREAGNAVVQIAMWIMHLPLSPDLARKAGELIGSGVEAGGAYFCEMGDGGGEAPDFANQDESTIGESCKKDKAAAEQQAAPKNPDAKQAPEFDLEKCKKDKQQQVDDEKRRSGANSGKEPRKNKNGQGMTPKKVAPDFKNGSRQAQFIGLSHGRRQLLEGALSGVRAGAWRSRETIEIPESGLHAFSQAEYFFDCKGKWTADDCNGSGESAMWRFRWRARLVRFDGGGRAVENVVSSVAAGIAAFNGTSRAGGILSLTYNNLRLREDLLRALRDPVIH
jgi:hypothetical protein